MRVHFTQLVVKRLGFSELRFLNSRLSHTFTAENFLLPFCPASERLTVPSYFAVSNYSVFRDELIDSLSLATSQNQNSTVIESYRITKN